MIASYNGRPQIYHLVHECDKTLEAPDSPFWPYEKRELVEDFAIFFSFFGCHYLTFFSKLMDGTVINIRPSHFLRKETHAVS